MNDAPTNRIDINRRIERAIYRSRHELFAAVSGPDTARAADVLDRILAQMLGEILPLVDLAEKFAEVVTIDRAIHAIRQLPAGPGVTDKPVVPVSYSAGDIIEVCLSGSDPGETRLLRVKARFVDGGEYWWGGEDMSGQALAGLDSRIVRVWKKTS